MPHHHCELRKRSCSLSRIVLTIVRPFVCESQSHMLGHCIKIWKRIVSMLNECSTTVTWSNVQIVHKRSKRPKHNEVNSTSTLNQNESHMRKSRWHQSRSEMLKYQNKCCSHHKAISVVDTSLQYCVVLRSKLATVSHKLKNKTPCHEHCVALNDREYMHQRCLLVNEQLISTSRSQILKCLHDLFEGLVDLLIINLNGQPTNL